MTTAPSGWGSSRRNSEEPAGPGERRRRRLHRGVGHTSLPFLLAGKVPTPPLSNGAAMYLSPLGQTGKDPPTRYDPCAADSLQVRAHRPTGSCFLSPSLSIFTVPPTRWSFCPAAVPSFLLFLRDAGVQTSPQPISLAVEAGEGHADR
jgi:hypothetical protein